MTGHDLRSVIGFPAPKQQIIDEGGAGRVCEVVSVDEGSPRKDI